MIVAYNRVLKTVFDEIVFYHLNIYIRSKPIDQKSIKIINKPDRIGYLRKCLFFYVILL